VPTATKLNLIRKQFIAETVQRNIADRRYARGGAMIRDNPVRVAILGTARVVSYGLLMPARQTPGVEIVAVGSRSLEKAQSFAALHGIPRAFGSYDAVCEATDVDAIYVALPTALHAAWVGRALAAGKHVLCEKPLAANAIEAAELVRLAHQHGRVLVEGLHIRYLRRLDRQREIVASGELGALRRIESCFRLPRVPMAPGDFRQQFEMGGGAGLDLGCYAVSCLRHVAGEEPEVTTVRHRTASPRVDRWMQASLRLPSGAAGVAECGFRGWYLPRMGVTVECERGSVTWNKAGIQIKQGGRAISEALPPDWTYQRQIHAFARSCRGEASDAVRPEDSLATAKVLDAMYERSGLGIRGARA
jgi:predicted dehydrogenase